MHRDEYVSVSLFIGLLSFLFLLPVSFCHVLRVGMSTVCRHGF
jgi:hypothetical protein